MRYRVRIAGISAIIHHDGASGLDKRSQESLEIASLAAKRGTNRTIEDDNRIQELECRRALWRDEGGAPTIPPGAVRAMIESGARKRKQGPQVRGGLVVESVDFEYDVERYGATLDELGKTAQFTVPVVVQRQRILRTRAKFDLPWACEFTLDCDDELVDEIQLGYWLDVAGRQVGIGDWRPEKSGVYGRFEIESIKQLVEA